MTRQIKCKKCRKTVLDLSEFPSLLINAHNTQILGSNEDNPCTSLENHAKIFLQEETLPSWILNYIEQENWTKGKIFCPHCNYRMGGFDFISGKKCDCQLNILPSVYFVPSKVDVMH